MICFCISCLWSDCTSCSFGEFCFSKVLIIFSQLYSLVHISSYTHPNNNGAQVVHLTVYHWDSHGISGATNIEALPGYVIWEQCDVECYLKYFFSLLEKPFPMATSHVIPSNSISNMLASIVKPDHLTTCIFFRALLPNPLCAFTVEICWMEI